MITIDDLKALQEQCTADMKPHIKAFEDAAAEYKKQHLLYNSKLSTTLEEYYDQQLVDENGNSVKVGSDIQKGKERFEVIDRGMQIIFGEFLDNNKVTARKFNSKGVLGKKLYSISKEELAGYVIVAFGDAFQGGSARGLSVDFIVRDELK